MKKSLADGIEKYVKALLARSEHHQIEIRRAEIAEVFACVPSQVTYVLSTRFIPEKGYYTESHRGGQGYIRIAESPAEFGPSSEEAAFGTILSQFEQYGLLNQREKAMLKIIMLKAGRNLPVEYEYQVYHNILAAIEEFLQS